MPGGRTEGDIDNLRALDLCSHSIFFASMSINPPISHLPPFLAQTESDDIINHLFANYGPTTNTPLPPKSGINLDETSQSEPKSSVSKILGKTHTHTHAHTHTRTRFVSRTNSHTCPDAQHIKVCIDSSCTCVGRPSLCVCVHTTHCYILHTNTLLHTTH